MVAGRGVWAFGLALLANAAARITRTAFSAFLPTYR